MLKPPNVITSGSRKSVAYPTRARPEALPIADLGGRVAINGYPKILLTFSRTCWLREGLNDTGSGNLRNLGDVRFPGYPSRDVLCLAWVFVGSVGGEIDEEFVIDCGKRDSGGLDRDGD